MFINFDGRRVANIRRSNPQGCSQNVGILDFSAGVFNVQFFNCKLILLCLSKGMDTEKFKYKWGGEDWDLLDRVFNAKLEVERIKYPGLYHHFHSKKNMWN